MASTDAGLILGLDHATLVVADLDAAVATHETLFAQPCTRRGVAPGLAWASFTLANTTLVLVAPHGAPEEPANALRAYLALRPAALGALGFAVAEPERAARLLDRRGLPGAGPAPAEVTGPAPPEVTDPALPGWADLARPWLAGSAAPLAPAAARGLHLLLTRPNATTGTATPGTSHGTTRLDHLVIRSGDPERSIALLAGRLGLELRLDRSNPTWGSRLLFFRCGDLVLEVSHDLAAGLTTAPDCLWGMTWGVPDVAAHHARLEAAGVPVSPLRVGRKPGTRIFTIREQRAGVPTAFIGA